jgi:hypothetical protein
MIHEADRNNQGRIDLPSFIKLLRRLMLGKPPSDYHIVTPGPGPQSNGTDRQNKTTDPNGQAPSGAIPAVVSTTNE